MRVGQLLKQARDNADLQQKDLAAAAGVLPSRLSRIESGQIEPDEAEITAIIEAINTPESRALAKDLQHDFKHVVTPYWEDLSAAERFTLREADATIRKDLRGLCEYWLADARGNEKPPRPLPEELERAYRNMAGLPEKDDEDPVRRLITTDIVEPNDLFSIVLQKINLPGRKSTELSYDADLDRK